MLVTGQSGFMATKLPQRLLKKEKKNYIFVRKSLKSKLKCIKR